MININDLKFMSIGCNCADIGFLGKDRIKGPVDNVDILRHEIFELLLSNKYFDLIKNGKYIKIDKKSWQFGWPNDYAFIFYYLRSDGERLIRLEHEDVKTIKYEEELLKRCLVFNDFYTKVLSDNNYYFTFCFNEIVIDNNKSKICSRGFIEESINIFIKYKILDKIIFVGTKTSNKDNVWNYNSEEFKYYIDKYNLKYIEIENNDIWDNEECHKQFLDKVSKLIERKKL